MSTSGDRRSAAGSFGAFLRAHRHDVLDDWVRRVRAGEAGRRAEDAPSLHDVPGLLEALAACTEPGESAGHPEPRFERELEGRIELAEVLGELSLLRDCALAAWRRAWPSGDLRQELAFHRAIDRAMATAAERYGAAARNIASAERAALAIENAYLHDESRHAVQVRDQILAVVSHDLRNPLSAIDLGSQLLRESAVTQHDPVAARQAEIIQRNTARMARLIGDLLDVSSIQAGKLAVDQRPVPIDALLREAYETHEPMAREKGVSLEATLGVGDAEVEGDRDRLVQVLANLLGNAIKFCHAGESITLEASVCGHEAQIRVADTGPGIAERDRAHVFDLYWKGRRGSTGLGLAIAKGIVEAHGGRIEVAARPRGTVFTFTLPLAA